MNEYTTQHVDIYNIAGASEFDQCWYSRIPKKIKTDYGIMLENYGFFTPIPIEDCDGYGLSENGILYNTNKHYLVKPEVIFSKDDKPIRAKLRIRKNRIYDIGELLLYVRFRLNPEYFRIEYTLKTDGVVFFVDTFNITFKTPVPLLLPQPTDILAVKFYNEYFVHRYDYKGLRYVSQYGAMYDIEKRAFLPIYIHRVASKADGGKQILRSFIYSGILRVSLIDFVIQTWTGVTIPKGYSLISTILPSTKVSLRDIVVRDYRKRTLTPDRYDPDKQAARNMKRDQLQNRIDRAIEETYAHLRKGVPVPECR